MMASRTLSQAELTAAGLSHPGLHRGTNEDRFHVDTGRGIFMVIDGVGGQAAGQHAAETALTVMRARLERATGRPTERVLEAITLANNEILRLSKARPEWAGMACVLTVVLVEDSTATIGHVGDTRLYRFSSEGVEKLTRDHSPVGEREDRGEISEAEAMRHPRRHEIYRDVGSEEHSPADEGFVEIRQVPFEPGMAMLLCTDGLTDLVPLARIRQTVLAEAGDPRAVVDSLIRAANESGGKDNVTAVYIEGPLFRETARALSLSLAAGSSFPWARRTGRAVRALGSRAAALLLSRWVVLLAGIAAGVGLSFLAFERARSVPAIWETSGRPLMEWSRTWVVGDGVAADFRSIGDALRRAAPGDTVVVEPGEYREAIHLSSSVSLISRKPREAVIRPPVGSPEDWVAVSIGPGTAGRLAGFRIAGDDESPMAVGLRLEEAATEVEDVEISGATRAGIEIERGAGGAIRASHIHGNPGAGILVRSGSVQLLHNVVSGNGRRQDALRPGLEKLEGARPVMFGNIVLNNGIEGIAGLDESEREQVLRENIVATGPRAVEPRQSPRPPR